MLKIHATTKGNIAFLGIGLIVVLNSLDDYGLAKIIQQRGNIVDFRFREDIVVLITHFWSN